MREQGGGHIINISGSASKGPGSGPYDDVTTSTYPGFTVGGVSKAALDRLTQGFAHEAFRLNIAANGLLPARSIASEGTAYHSGGVEAMHGAYVDGEIMADAAVAICVKEPRSFTGNIVTDEEMLQNEDIDISGYARVP